MKSKFSLKRILSTVLATCCLAGVFVTLPMSISASEKDINAYAPKGTSNVAIGAEVSISNCTAERAGQENSYEQPTENWCKAMLVDGDINTGWSTDPYDKEPSRETPVTVTLKLKQEANVAAIGLFAKPDNSFPAKYTLSVSTDGVTYTDVITDATFEGSAPAEPIIHEFNATAAKYVRIHITLRGTKTGPDGALAQIAEVAVYGKENKSMTLNRTSLELYVNEKDTIKPVFTGFTTEPKATFKSDNEAVVSVDANGNITAKKLGKATITVTCESFTAKCNVEVVDKKFNFDDNILLSIFWPPTPNYINDEQYKLIADAGINWVLGAGEETLATPEIQKKMLELCAKYNIGMTVSDGNFGNNLLGKSESEIAELVNNYKNVPGAYGFYILDEPVNANVYVDAYIALKKANPNAYMHLNFLPLHYYGSSEKYYAQMNDWCKLCAASGYDVDYLIFDNYPFPLSGEMNRQGFLENLRVCHDVGLDNNVKTGTYIQTICQEVGFRRPSASEIRYEMYLSLAFGYKQLSFFTWFTPVNRSEPFKDGIISADGVPNEHYETVKTINHEILAIGDILVKCNAEEIYLNGKTWGQPSIPKDFFVQPGDRKNYTVSYLRHTETGANYLMVVNNNYNKAQTISLNFDSKIKSLSEVSRVDGSLKPLTMDGSKLSLTLEAGDAILIALPEGYDYYTPNTTANPEAGTNLATLPEASVTATTSVGANGYYISALNDGKLSSDSVITGWASAGKAADITINLGAVRKVNRVDFYPTGSIADYGDTFPKNMEIFVSKDGKTYTSVAKVEDYKVVDSGKSVKFDMTEAQYIRVSIAAGTEATLAEIAVYEDNGTVGNMPTFDGFLASDVIVDYTEGDNIALNRPTYYKTATDPTYEQWGWAPKFINDGNPTTGYTSNVKTNWSADSTEYIFIDLCDTFAIKSLKITPMGHFPIDYTIDVSANGRVWTTVHSVTGSENLTEAFEIALEKVENARFVRLQATKLRGDNADGYMLQLGEIEVYGTPVTDTTALKDAIKAYEESGASLTVKAYTNAVEALKDTTLTQTEANSYKEALLALIKKPGDDEKPGTDVPGGDNGTNKPEEDTTTSETETTIVEETSTAPTEETTAEEKKGCSSSAAISAAVLSTLGAAFIISKKKKEDEE